MRSVTKKHLNGLAPAAYRAARRVGRASCRGWFLAAYEPFYTKLSSRLSIPASIPFSSPWYCGAEPARSTGLFPVLSFSCGSAPYSCMSNWVIASNLLDTQKCNAVWPLLLRTLDGNFNEISRNGKVYVTSAPRSKSNLITEICLNSAAPWRPVFPVLKSILSISVPLASNCLTSYITVKWFSVPIEAVSAFHRGSLGIPSRRSR